MIWGYHYFRKHSYERNLYSFLGSCSCFASLGRVKSSTTGLMSVSSWLYSQLWKLCRHYVWMEFAIGPLDGPRMDNIILLSDSYKAHFLSQSRFAHTVEIEIQVDMRKFSLRLLCNPEDVLAIARWATIGNILQELSMHQTWGIFMSGFLMFRISLWEGLTVWPLMAKVYSYFESRGCDREGWHEFASLVGNLVACLAVAFWLNVFQLKSAKLKFHQSRCSGLLGVEVTSQGLQYFLKRYLSGPVVLTLVDFQ